MLENDQQKNKQLNKMEKQGLEKQSSWQQAKHARLDFNASRVVGHIHYFVASVVHRCDSGY